jgi:hypothetical protein
MRKRATLILSLALACFAVAACGGSSGRSDASVANDLKALLTSNGVDYITVGPCVHQTGNQYVCGVFTANLSSDSALVIDDGHSVSETPIAK